MEDNLHDCTTADNLLNELDKAMVRLYHLPTNTHDILVVDEMMSTFKRLANKLRHGSAFGGCPWCGG